MSQFSSTKSKKFSRLGLHYFPDSLHYRQSDLNTWLPILKSLGASWLVIQSESNRAIPEHFLKSIQEEGIEPLIQFPFSLETPPTPAELTPILTSYAKWGMKWIIFSERPNSHHAWPQTGHISHDFVANFLDSYTPLAERALNLALTPIFPPLEPGGNYWDTTFLQAALEMLVEREETRLLDNLVLSAYAWYGGHSLNWGAGGPKKWGKSIPYIQPENQQDQRGFRIYNWYNAICEETIGHKIPIILLQAGCPTDPNVSWTDSLNLNHHTDANLAIARLLAGETITTPEDPKIALDPIPEEVIACNLWLLTAEQTSDFHHQAWFQADGNQLPIVNALQKWYDSFQPPVAFTKTATQPKSVSKPRKAPTKRPAHSLISHYLLLSINSPWLEERLNSAQLFLLQHQATLGFSLKEASLSKHVTVFGNTAEFPEETLNRLRQAGCIVDRINEDGTLIAT